jgi:hypothetical protein
MNDTGLRPATATSAVAQVALNDIFIDAIVAPRRHAVEGARADWLKVRTPGSVSPKTVRGAGIWEAMRAPA